MTQVPIFELEKLLLHIESEFFCKLLVFIAEGKVIGKCSRWFTARALPLTFQGWFLRMVRVPLWHYPPASIALPWCSCGTTRGAAVALPGSAIESLPSAAVALLGFHSAGIVK